MPIRYNTGQIASRHVAKLAAKHLPRLGKLLQIEGKRFKTLRGLTREAVLIRGENGTALFGGVLWGYSGEGPRALQDLLVLAGIEEWAAMEIAFNSTRHDSIGQDWVYDFQTGTFNVKVEKGNNWHRIAA